MKSKILYNIKKDKNGCWVWQKSLSKKGYGNLYFNRKTLKAHRESYRLFNGEFDNKLHVLHKCDNPSCVNPEHLFLGTNLDNVEDRVKKGRSANKLNGNHKAYVKPESVPKGEKHWRTNNPNNPKSYELPTKQGELHHNAKLTEKEVIEIMNLKGGKSQREIALLYNVSQTLIMKIHQNKYWKHLKKQLCEL